MTASAALHYVVRPKICCIGTWADLTICVDPAGAYFQDTD